MAAFVFGGGSRAQALAEAILTRTTEAAVDYGTNESGARVITKITAPCLQITRRMMEKTQFDGEGQYGDNVDRLLHYYGMRAEGKLLRLDGERVIVADDDGDKLVSLQCKTCHKGWIKQYADKIGVSGNDFILRAIEYYCTYLAEAEEEPDVFDE